MIALNHAFCSFRSFAQRAIHVSLLASIFGLSFLSSAYGGWGLPSQPSEQRLNDAIDALSRLPSLQSAETQAMFDRVGFTPDMPQNDWQALSYREQIEIAYRSAEAHHAGNGRSLISSMARIIESRYESLAYDPAFQDLFIERTKNGNIEKIHFSTPTGAQLGSQLPKNVELQLIALSHYVDGSGPMSRTNILRKFFGLKSPEFEQALAKRDPKQFLMEAARLAVPPPEIEVRTNMLAEEALRRYESASNNPAIKSAIESIHAQFGENPPKTTSVDQVLMLNDDEKLVPVKPDSSLGGGGGGGGPQRLKSAAKAHANIDTTFYKTASSRSFRTVRGRAGGRGGVIAGASVTKDNSIKGKPVAFSIEVPDSRCDSPRPELITGSINIKLSTGMLISYRNVPCDELITAKQLAFDSIGPVNRWEPSEAIGLVSIDVGSKESIFPYFIPSDLDPSKMGERKRMILHPALVDWDIGRSITLLDLWPSVRGAISQLTTESPSVLAWLKELETKKAATWKFSDSPMVLHVEGDTLQVNPSSKQTHIISMIVFNEKEMVKEAGDDQANQIIEDMKRNGTNIEKLRNACKKDEDKIKQAINGLKAKEVKDVTKEMELIQIAFACSAVLHTGSQSASGRNVKKFDTALPELRRNIPDFDRAESLMKTLAVYRWVREAGAKFEGAEPIISEQRRKTPDTLVLALDKSWIAIAPEAHSFQDDCNTFLRRLDNLISKKSDPTFSSAWRTIDNKLIESLVRSPDIKRLRKNSCKLPTREADIE